MRPESVLGFDPAPGDPLRLVSLADALRKVVRALVEARTAVMALNGSAALWAGPDDAPVIAAVQRYAGQFSLLEEPLVECLQALDGWRTGVGERQSQVAQIVESVADLAGLSGVDERRARLLTSARELRDEHDQQARVLSVAFEQVSSAAERVLRPTDDLAVELNRALLARAAAVEDWVRAEGLALLRSATSLGEVASLTTVISEVVGIAALGRHPGETAGVATLVARSPGSHRLIRALARSWLQVDPASLPEATFAHRPTALRGRR